MMALVDMSVLSYIFKSIKVILQSPGKLSNLLELLLDSDHICLFTKSSF